MPLKDESWGLYTSPTDPNALQWSEDNLLAVPGGPAAIILDPAHLGGVRMSTAQAPGDFSHLDVGGALKDPDSNVHHQMLANRQHNFNPRNMGLAMVRLLAWSPLGCGATGGCVLCTITDDLRVKLFARLGHHSVEWTCFADLSDLLATHLRSNGWAEAGGRRAEEGGQPLQLRGGAPPLPFFQGQNVEVLSQKPGSKVMGGWYAGVVETLAQNFALVSLPKLAKNGMAPREWFPLHPASSLDRSDVPDTYPCNYDNLSSLRPKPPLQDGLSIPWRLGDEVDVLQNNAWRSGEVIGVMKPVQRVRVTLFSTSRTTTAKYENTRRSREWDGREFVPLPEVKEEEQPSSPRKQKTAEKPAKAPSVKEAGAGKAATAKAQAPSKKLVAETLDSDDDNVPILMPAQKKQKVTVEGAAQGPTVAKGKTGNSAAAKPDTKPPAGTKRKGGDAEGQGGSLASTRADAAKPAKKSKPGKAAPASKSASKSSSKASGKSSGTKGSVEPAKVPVVKKKKEPVKAAAESSDDDLDDESEPSGDDTEEDEFKPAGAAAAAESGDEDSEAGSEDSLAEDGAARVLSGMGSDSGGGKQRQTQKPRKPPTRQHARSKPTLKPKPPPAKEPESESEEEEEGNDGAGPSTSTSTGRRKKGKPVYIPDEYQVPADFDASVLLPVDDSEKKLFIKGFLDSFLERWLILRCEVDPDKLAVYFKGSHMHGPDVLLYEQTRAEMTHAFGKGLEKHGLNQKWVNTECKRVIRTTIINPKLGELVMEHVMSTPEQEKETPTQRALRRVREKRRQRDQPIVRTKVTKAAAAPLPQKRSLVVLAKPRIRKEDGGSDTTLSPLEYEARSTIIQPRSLAWSPVFPGEGQAFCMLAVGSKGGRVWLWRYRLPTISAEPPLNSEASGLELAGSFKAASAWVNALSWAPGEVGGRGLLCVGCSDGTVKLAAFDASDLRRFVASRTPLPEPHLWTLLQPSLNGITTMDTACQDEGLAVAIGRQDGSIASCCLPSVDLERARSLDAALQKAPWQMVGRAHGTMPVTSVAWRVRLPQPGSGAPDLMTCGTDGAVKIWQFTNELEARPGLPSSEPDKGFQEKVLLGSYGVASSGNGLMAAVAREGSSNCTEATLEIMTHKRLWKGCITLHPLKATATAVRQALAVATAADSLSVAKLWDVVAAMHTLAGKMAPPQARPQEGEGGDGEGEGEPPKQEDPRVCTSELTKEVLAGLEETCHRIMSTPASKRRAAEKSLFTVLTRDARRGLQIACALRCLLHPHVLNLQALENLLPALEPDKSPFTRQWEAQTRQDEFALLQCHVKDRLEAEAVGVNLSRALMTDWATRFESQVEADLAEAGRAVRNSTGGGGAANGDLQPREEYVGEPVGLQEGVHPLAGALHAEFSFEGGRMCLARCPATMTLCDDSAPWHCPTCKRLYSLEGADAVRPPRSCIFCGLRLLPHARCVAATALAS